MGTLIDLLFLLLGWLLLDFLGIITLIKPNNKPRNWKNRINFKSLIDREHIIISLVLGLTGIILLISSFSFPWYHHLYFAKLNFEYPYYLQYLYIKEAINLDRLLYFFIYCAYLNGLILIFIKISVKKKIRTFTAIEFIELIFIIIGIIFMLNIKFSKCSQAFILAGYDCIESGRSSGFILYTIGLTILIINGLQMSIYSRLKRSKNKIIRI